MKNRDIDIAIPNEKDQNLLVKFLFYKMKTVDGIKNTGIEPVEKILGVQQAMYYWKTATNYSSKKLAILGQRNQSKMLRCAYFRYLVLKFR